MRIDSNRETSAAAVTLRTATAPTLRAADKVPAACAFGGALMLALLLGGCAGSTSPTTTATGAGEPGTVAPPALGWFSKIAAPDTEGPVLRLQGRGVQVFRCEARNADWIWAARLPEGALFDGAGAEVGTLGAGFTFAHGDGSRLTGTVLTHQPAPRPEDLPWLLLATRAYGTGALGGVTHAQRVDTQGGMPPAQCSAAARNQLLRVPFTAEFVFYRPR